MRRLGILVVALVASLGLAACNGGGNQTAATVNGQKIKTSTLEDDVKALVGNKTIAAQLDRQYGATSGSSGTANSAVTALWLGRLMNEALVHQEFEHRNLHVTADQEARAKQAIGQQFGNEFANLPKSFQDRQVAATGELVALSDDLQKSKGPADLRKLFDSTKCTSGILLAHILVKTEPEAAAIEAQLAQGADFATLAKQKSIDTGSGAQGGLLLCRGTGDYSQFVKEFRDAADKLQVGQTSAPVHSQFGYHIIRAIPWTFANAQPLLTAQAAQANPLDAFAATATAKAKVSVNPRFGTATKSSSGLGVKPPAAPNPKQRPATTTTTAPKAPGQQVPGAPATPSP
ncbi:MAG TPA: peptidylprolyl isomerase [Acidimicrobiia bacterium]